MNKASLMGIFKTVSRLTNVIHRLTTLNGPSIFTVSKRSRPCMNSIAMNAPHLAVLIPNKGQRHARYSGAANAELLPLRVAIVVNRTQCSYEPEGELSVHEPHPFLCAAPSRSCSFLRERHGSAACMAPEKKPRNFDCRSFSHATPYRPFLKQPVTNDSRRRSPRRSRKSVFDLLQLSF